MVERRIQRMESVVRSAIAAEQVEDRNMKDWLGEVEFAINAAKDAEGRSYFENLYGVHVRTPIRAIMPLSVDMTENQRKKWQVQLREEVADTKIRNAMREPVRKGANRSDRVVNFKKGATVWVRRRGGERSRLVPKNYAEGIFVKTNENERSVTVRIGRNEKKVALADVVRRLPTMENKPSDEEIRRVLQTGGEDAAADEELKFLSDLLGDSSEEEGANHAADLSEERIEETDDEAQENHEGKGTEVKEMASDIKENRQTEEDLAGLSVESPRAEEQDEQDQLSEEDVQAQDWTQRQVSFQDYTTWNIVIGVDKQSQQAYAMAVSPRDGDVAILERVSKTTKPEYHMLWYKRSKNKKGYVKKASKHLPDTQWDEWMCKRDDYDIVEDLGQALNENNRMREETDMKFLELRIRQRQKIDKEKDGDRPKKKRKTR